ncbi:MAG: HEAT repeat domain-containing protein [Actinobacteria bacterium]|nr:HEAT repeat domain-containing protein [Actinomycetota bacterium]
MSTEKHKLSHKQAVAIALGDTEAKSAAQTPLQMQRRLLYAENAKGVLADLADAGFVGIEEVGELRSRRVDYRAAVPVLLRWLPRVSYLLLAEDIVRTLSVSFAKKLAVPEFLQLFREPPSLQDPLRPATSEPPKEHLRWIIGNGLSIFAGPSLAGELIELALDRRFGHARYQIVSALPKTKDARVADVLMGLLDDPTVRAAAVDALGKIKFRSARTTIERLLSDPDKNVRDQAKKALKRMER